MEFVITVVLLAAGIGMLLWPAWFRAESRAKLRRDPGDPVHKLLAARAPEC